MNVADLTDYDFAMFRTLSLSTIGLRNIISFEKGKARSRGWAGASLLVLPPFFALPLRSLVLGWVGRDGVGHCSAVLCSENGQKGGNGPRNEAAAYPCWDPTDLIC
jgi:hypothetical protein